MKKIYITFILTFFYLGFFQIIKSQTYNDFRDSYGNLSTIAGKGSYSEKSYNGWKASFEGGSAIDAELSRPHIALADTNGNIYIADKDAHAIRKVDINGNISTVAGTSVEGYDGDGIANEHQLNAPNGMWVMENGTFYILDLNNNRIRKVDLEGNMTTVVHDSNGISIGRGLYVTKNEDTIFYVGGSSVKRWTSASGIENFIGGFSQLGNIVQDFSGNLIITDRGANKVFRLSKNTHELVVIAGNGSIAGGGDGEKAKETALYGVRGVWVLEDGSFFVATHEGSQIWHVDTDSIIHLFLNGTENDDAHSGDGEDYKTPGYKISEARAVTVDYKGNVIVTENDRGFIRMIEKKSGDISIESESIYASDINVYPNPAHSFINLEYNLENSTQVKIMLLNSFGQTVNKLIYYNTSQGKNILPISVNELQPGFYFLQLEVQGSAKMTKFVIE